MWSPDVASMAPYLIPATGGIVYTGSWNGLCFIVPYNSTKFRILFDNNNINSFSVFSSSWYSANFSMSLIIEFEIWV